ncbi:MAG: hypothetical protein IPI34_07870 [bacterium]|nr:hypothetical protein [bacterium]
MRPLAIAALVLVFCTTAAAERSAPEPVLLASPPALTVTACLTGNTTATATYSGWWGGNESYARLLSAAAPGCNCSVGLSVTTAHMLMVLEPGADLTVQARLLTAAGAPGCLSPGSVLAISLPRRIRDIAAAGVYDVAVPCDFVCAEAGQDYFLVVDFVSGSAPNLALVGGGEGHGCATWNDWGTGWIDLVGAMGFLHDLTIWADLDCCYQAIPSERGTWGGIKADYR